MNRRIALKQFIIFSAGVAFLPSCLNEKKKKVSAYNNIPIEAEQEALLAAIASVLLPSTNSPGAKEVDAHLFVLKMMNDCFKKEDREKFISGLKQFQDNIKKQYKKSFADCSPEEQQSIITAANTQKDGKDDAAFFYGVFKYLTIEAYTSSKYYLTNVDIYKLIPGKFISSVHV